MASRIDDLSANGTTSATIRIGDPGPRPAFPGPWALFADFRDEYRARRRGSFPRGANRPSIRTTWRFRHDVLNLLLESYQRHGPIFGLRIVFGYNLAMIGPEANHFMLVSGRENFGWRHGRMGDLLTLIGDGLLTTDGDYHDGSRAILMPAFHRERIATAAALMGSEAAAAVDALPAGASTDVYEWARTLAMRIAMGALFGFDPDSGRAGAIAARFESGLGFHAREFPMQMLFGPGTPLAKLKRDRTALEEMVGEEIARRRRRGEDGGDVLSSLLASTDGEGRSLSDRQVLDHVLTLLFAGHDTATSTVSFLVYELARNPEWADRLAAELDDVLRRSRPRGRGALRRPAPPDPGRRRDPAPLPAGVDRPAPLGPRLRVQRRHRPGRDPLLLQLLGQSSPARGLRGSAPLRPRPGSCPSAGPNGRAAPTSRSGWARGSASASASATPRSTRSRRPWSRRFRFELPGGHELEIHQSPTLSPQGGLPVRLTPALSDLGSLLRGGPSERGESG